MKKFFSLLLAVAMLAAIPVTAGTGDYLYGTSKHWEAVYGSPTTYTPHPWVIQYSGYPAGRDGEVDTCGWSETYSHHDSGSFGLGIKEQAELEFGYTFGAEETWPIQIASTPLKKGECVKLYSRDCWLQRTVTSKECRVETWLNPDKLPSSWTTHTLTGTTKTAKCNQAVMPQIKLEYWKDGAQRNRVTPNSMSELIRVEFYTHINGAYVLTNINEY